MTQTSTATATRTTDRFGNVLHVVTRDGNFLGTADKTCSGKWEATYASGSYVPGLSLKAAVALLGAQ